MIHWSWGLQTTELREPPLLSKPTKLHCYQNPCLVSLFRSLSRRRSGGGGCAIRTRCRRWSGGGGASPSARAKFGSCNFVYNKVRTNCGMQQQQQHCCVELRGATAGAAELRGAAGSGGLYGRSRLAYVRKVRTLRETARARARAGRVGGALATRVFRLEPTRELGRGLLMHGARLLPLCYRPRTMMRCHTDECMSH